MVWVCRVDDDGHALHPRQSRSKNIKLLSSEIARNQRGDTRHVSTGLGKGGGKTQTDGIADEEHDNRYVRGRVLCSECSLRSDDNYEIGFRLHEVGGERRKLVEAIIRVLAFDDKVIPLDPAELAKLVEKGGVVDGVALGSTENSDPRHFRGRLGCGCGHEDKQHKQKDGN